MSRTCWNCQHIAEGPIHFKTVCEKCLAYLHCCMGCQYYSIGKPNHCLVPGTDPVRERDQGNYCDEFKVKEKGDRPKGPSLDDVSKRLFGE